MIAAVISLAILSQPVPVPLVYGVAECSGWPLTKNQLAADGILVQSVHVRANRVMARLYHPATKRRAHLVAHRVGSREAGWTVWSLRAPSAVAQLIAASPACRIATSYQQVMTWPVAAKVWLADRSTCYGEATWRGRAYVSWPCIWATDRAGTVTSLDGIGPGVTAGGSGAAAAGVE